MATYFHAYTDYFWYWDKDSMGPDQNHYIATIPNAQAIGYAENILQVLEVLSHQGIPPFGSVLLALIASNSDINDTSFTILTELLISKQGASSKTVTNAIEVLEHIRNLPKELKTGENKTLLFQTLFKDCHNRLAIKNSQSLIKAAQKNISFALNYEVQNAYTNQTFIADIRPIALLIRNYKSSQDIINAMHNIPDTSSLDEIEIEEKLPINESENLPLVNQLLENIDTYQIGSLVKRIWSGINIPMHNSLPSNQPLGGVSDITNKGDFSRLLISEYAFEDDTFMSRIANNEALYIEREAPPEANNRHRIFLIDGSIKNWGIPRLLSIATSLAIGTHPKSNFEFTAYILGDDLAEAPLDSVIQIIGSQHILFATLDCHLGLEKYFQSELLKNNQEIFFLTEEKNLLNTNLQKVFSAYHELFNYIITTNVDGDINFYKHQNKSRKHLQHLILPYQQLWTSHLPKSTFQNNYKNVDVESLNSFLDPIEKGIALFLPHNENVYVFQNKTLYSFTSKGPEKGLQPMYTNIPNTNHSHYLIVANKRKELILVHFNFWGKETSRINLKTGHILTKRIYSVKFENQPLSLFTLNNKVYITNETDYWTVDEDCKLISIKNDHSYSKALLKQEKTIQNFNYLLKTKGIRYSVLKNIDTISLYYFSPDDFYLNIQGHILDLGRLNLINKSSYYSTSYKFRNSIPLARMATLYLKNPGEHAIRIVKILKDRCQIPLGEAREITLNAPCKIMDNIPIDLANNLKLELENEGAICYIKTHSFVSEDGSIIKLMNNQLVFISSIKTLPTFWITSVINFDLAMSADLEFSGNPYFLPVKNEFTKIKLDEFWRKYINPFLKVIIENED